MKARPPAVLRRVLPSDDEAILEAFKAEDMSRQGDVRDLASAATYARQLSDNPFAFALDANGSLLGVVALNVDHENRLGWFWYWTHRSHRHRGLTKRAAVPLTTFGAGPSLREVRASAAGRFRRELDGALTAPTGRNAHS